MEEKTCRICGITQPIDNFHYHYGSRDNKKNECRECCRKYNRAREIRNGHKPFTQSKSCSWYLGVHVAERLLKTVFVNVEEMPRNQRGYDFICGKGFKVDVKSSCLLNTGNSRYRHWTFTTKRNIIPDYFACIAVDNRFDLNPCHFWLIPEQIVNGRRGLTISESKRGLSKWQDYEKPIDKLIEGCKILKVVA